MKKFIITSAIVAALAFTPVLPAAASTTESSATLATTGKAFDVNSLAKKPGVKIVAADKEMLTGMAKAMGAFGSKEAKPLLKAAENLDKMVIALLPESGTELFDQTKKAVADNDDYEEGTTIESAKLKTNATVFAKTANGLIKEVVVFVTTQSPALGGGDKERKAVVQIFGNFTQDDIATLLNLAGDL